MVIKEGYKQTVLEYVDLRAGLVKVAITDYFYDLSFSNMENVKKELESLLSLFSFETKLGDINVIDNNSIIGEIYVKKENNEYVVVNFNCNFNITIIE